MYSTRRDIAYPLSSTTGDPDGVWQYLVGTRHDLTHTKNNPSSPLCTEKSQKCSQVWVRFFILPKLNSTWIFTEAYLQHIFLFLLILATSTSRGANKTHWGDKLVRIVKERGTSCPKRRNFAPRRHCRRKVSHIWFELYSHCRWLLSSCLGVLRGTSVSDVVGSFSPCTKPSPLVSDNL